MRITLNNYPFTTLMIFDRGIRLFRFYNTGQKQFDVDIAIIDM